MLGLNQLTQAIASNTALGLQLMALSTSKSFIAVGFRGVRFLAEDDSAPGFQEMIITGRKQWL